MATFNANNISLIPTNCAVTLAAFNNHFHTLALYNDKRSKEQRQKYTACPKGEHFSIVRLRTLTKKNAEKSEVESA